MVLSGRYSSFERRVLEWFVEEENTDTIQCWGRDFDLMYLIKDGFIIDSGARSQNSLNFPPKIYRLTDSGKEFVEKWKTAKLLN